MTMPDEMVVFLRRQSPDWAALAQDYRAGRPIDPARFVPDHAVPGFPQRVDRLVAAWNERFRTDFFTVRAIMAQLGAASLAGIANARAYSFESVNEVAAHARTKVFFAYPHDDDDFFAPYIGDVLAHVPSEADAVVTPLYRIGASNRTFARGGCKPDYVLDHLRAHDYRFQTNNYAIHARRLGTVKNILALTDHIEASAYADAHGFTDYMASTVISATVKTPASASVLESAFKSRLALRRAFKRTIDGLHAVELPEKFGWLTRPSTQIARLLEAVYRGKTIVSASELS